MKNAETPKGGGSEGMAYRCPVGHTCRISSTISPLEKDDGIERYGFFLCQGCASPATPIGKVYMVKTGSELVIIPDFAALWWVDRSVVKLANTIHNKAELGFPVSDQDKSLFDFCRVISNACGYQAQDDLLTKGYMYKGGTNSNGDDFYLFRPKPTPKGDKTSLN